ncbi:MAG: DUF58 domain-containing protein [Burkholderiales bacterium]|nr:DUF58 domain-containing protein [Burkholderiales bacterium]
MRPAPALVAIALAWLVLGLAAAIQPALHVAWLAAGALSAVVAFADWLLVRAAPGLAVRREMAHALSVGVAAPVRLDLANRGARGLRLEIHDRHPGAGEAQGLPFHVTLPAGRTVRHTYQFTPHHRGDLDFAGCDLRLRSPFGLWERRITDPVSTQCRVYPDFSALAGYALLATDNRLSQLGVLQRRRRGEGLDFHQLRDYRESDPPRALDWKATARVRRPIAREYRDERDQRVLFLIDCGRRLSTGDTDARHLTHFDHALNAALLLAYVAARQGDAVGYLTFATPAPRSMAPRKSRAAVNQMLHTLFDVQPGLNAPDYTRAAVDATRLAGRRSLVVVLSNLRGEDDDALLPALSLLKQRHLVLFASLREPVLDATLAAPVRHLDDALTRIAAGEYAQMRERSLDRLGRSGAEILDVAPRALPIALVNRYLDIKRSARL